MWRSKFFWKLYLTYTALVLLTTTIIGVLVHDQMKRSLLDDVERNLREKLTLISQQYQGHSPLEHDFGHLRKQAESVGVRLTLIDPTGKVLVDSEKPADELENHANRPEVLSAMHSGFGKSTRYSTSSNQWMLYLANTVNFPEGKAVVRLSLPLVDVDARLALMRATLLIGAAVGFLVALIMGGFVAKRITYPIQEITNVAQAMRQGHYQARFHSLSEDEIGILGSTFNSLGEELSNRMLRLSREENRLRTILASMTEGVIAIDQHGCVLFCNVAAKEILGGIRVDTGLPLWQSVEIWEIRQLVEKARQTGEAIRNEIVLNRNGVDRNIFCVARSISGDVTKGVVLVLQDTTELKRLEGIRRDFVANVSHELRTPLTSIKGYVETLLSGALEDEQNNVRFLKKIETHVDHLYALVQDLLSLARIEGPDKDVPLTSVNLSSFVRERMMGHEMAAEKAGLKLHAHIPDEACMILADRKALGQVVDNLVENAIKYTEKGSITVSVSANERSGIFSVADTGYGIAREDLPRIFERFYRADKSRSPGIKGTGLGLSIVKHLVTAMKGQVSVESNLGKGSVFRVELSRTEPEMLEGLLHSEIDKANRNKNHPVLS